MIATGAASPSLRSNTFNSLTFDGETENCRGRLVLGRDEAQELAEGGPYPAHRPEEPAHRLLAAAARCRQQHAGLLREVHKDRTRVEHCPWAAHAVVVDDRRHLSIRRDGAKLRRVLLA
jgi:hypothetical protein